MAKRFELIIPDLIPRNELMKLQKWMFDILTIGDGQIITEDHRCFKYIPKDWLHEIRPTARKTEGTMNKKYKLEIPEMIKKEDAWIVHILDGKDIVEDGFSYSNPLGKVFFDDIPKNWLKEINDDPSTFEEWCKSYNITPSDMGFDIVKSCYDWTLETFAAEKEPDHLEQVKEIIKFIDANRFVFSGSNWEFIAAESFKIGKGWK